MSAKGNEIAHLIRAFAGPEYFALDRDSARTVQVIADLLEEGVSDDHCYENDNYRDKILKAVKIERDIRKPIRSEPVVELEVDTQDPF